MTDMVIMPGSHYQSICDAVRAKTGDTAVLKSGDLKAAIAGITGGGDQVERGSFIADSTGNMIIPCAFEPDVIFVNREQEINADGDVRCITKLIFIKNLLATGRYVPSDGSTTDVDGVRQWLPSGYGTLGVSYSDGTISGEPNLNGRPLREGYTYNYVLGRCGL